MTQCEKGEYGNGFRNPLYKTVRKGKAALGAQKKNWGDYLKKIRGDIILGEQKGKKRLWVHDA